MDIHKSFINYTLAILTTEFSINIKPPLFILILYNSLNLSVGPPVLFSRQLIEIDSSIFFVEIPSTNEHSVYNLHF